MSKSGFTELYGQIRESYTKLLDLPIENLNVWCVDREGYGSVKSVTTCSDFGGITEIGSVIVIPDHAAYLKTRGHYWVRTTLGVSGTLFLDSDIISALLSNDDVVATLINPK